MARSARCAKGVRRRKTVAARCCQKSIVGGGEYFRICSEGGGQMHRVVTAQLIGFGNIARRANQRSVDHDDINLRPKSFKFALCSAE